MRRSISSQLNLLLTPPMEQNFSHLSIWPFIHFLFLLFFLCVQRMNISYISKEMVVAAYKKAREYLALVRYISSLGVTSKKSFFLSKLASVQIRADPKQMIFFQPKDSQDWHISRQLYYDRH